MSAGASAEPAEDGADALAAVEVEMCRSLLKWAQRTRNSFSEPSAPCNRWIPRAALDKVAREMDIHVCHRSMGSDIFFATWCPCTRPLVGLHKHEWDSI
jgi:hypothetical protein